MRLCSYVDLIFCLFVCSGCLFVRSLFVYLFVFSGATDGTVIGNPGSVPIVAPSSIEGYSPKVPKDPIIMYLGYG